MGGVPRHFGLVWIGAPCGLLLGIGLYGAAGIAVGALSLRDSVPASALVIGGGLGALAGVWLMRWLARPRPLR